MHNEFETTWKELSLAVGATVAGIVLLLCYASWTSRGCIVDVVNKSAAPIENVHLEVAGKRYPIGRVQTSRRRRVRTFPKGEGSVVLSYIDGASKPIRASAGYVEARGYRVVFTIGADGVTAVETTLGLPLDFY